MIGLKWEQSKAFKQLGAPSYCRVLGFNNKGKQLLRSIADNSQYPVINKVADFNTDDPVLQSIFEFDIKSTDIYNLGYPGSKHKRAGEDYRTSPVYVRY
jgi:hypothetical protein